MTAGFLGFVFGTNGEGSIDASNAEGANHDTGGFDAGFDAGGGGGGGGGGE